MATIGEVVRDENFQALAPQERMKVLNAMRSADPVFSQLPPAEQEKAFRVIAGSALSPGFAPVTQPMEEGAPTGYPDKLRHLADVPEDVRRRYGVMPEQLTEARQGVGELGRMAGQAAIPVGMGLLGAAGGGFVGGPPGAMVGESVMSAGGEAINQALGITEPSGAQIALAGAAGPLTRGAVGAGQYAVKRAAPMLSGAGESLRNMAAKTATGIADFMRPTTKVDDLFSVVRQFNPKIDLTPVKELASRISKEQAPRKEFGVDLPGGVESVVSKTKQALQPPKPVTSTLIDPSTGRPFVEEVSQAAAAPMRNFQDVWEVMKGVNDKIGALKREGGEGFGEMMQLKRAFAESIENTPGAGPAQQALRAANKAWKEEYASDFVTDVIHKKINFLEGRETISLGAGQAIKAIREAIRKDPFLEDSFPSGAVDRILKNLEEIRKLPVPGAPAGADAGTKRLAKQSLVGGAAGEIINYASGGGMPIGVSASLGGLAAIGVSDLVSHALQTQAGGRLLLNILRSSPTLDHTALSMLAGFVRSQTAQPGEMLRTMERSD